MPHYLIRLSRNDGQTMAEYAVILAVITPLVLLALAALAGSLETAIENITAQS